MEAAWAVLKASWRRIGSPEAENSGQPSSKLAFKTEPEPIKIDLKINQFFDAKSLKNQSWGSLGASWGRLGGRMGAHRVRAGHLVAFCGVFDRLGTSWGRLGVVLGAS